MIQTQKLALPGTARGGWVVDPAAFREACDLLGVTRPVEVKIVGASRIGGNYSNRSGVHHIHVKTDSTPERATETLWHELTHAAQCESFETPLAFIRAYGAATMREGGGRTGYFNNPYEVEARSNAAAFADVSLTRPAHR